MDNFQLQPPSQKEDSKNRLLMQERCRFLSTLSNLLENKTDNWQSQVEELQKFATKLVFRREMFDCDRMWDKVQVAAKLLPSDTVEKIDEIGKLTGLFKLDDWN